MNRLLEIEKLSVNFGGLSALDDFSMNVEEGSVHAIIGPNGAGKSTLLNCISRLIVPDGGNIRLDGVDLLKRPAHDMIHLGINRTFQNIALFPGMTVEENLLVGLHHSMKGGSLRGGVRTRLVRQEEEKAREEIGRLLGDLHIDAYRYSHATDLPIGIQRLVELARSLLSSPRLLLLDEPASGMTLPEKEALDAFLIQCKVDYGLTILLIEHDMNFVMAMAQEITVLDFGKKIAEGNPERVLKDEKVLEAYLGREHA